MITISTDLELHGIGYIHYIETYTEVAVFCEGRAIIDL